jgi:hypothetical protein
MPSLKIESTDQPDRIEAGIHIAKIETAVEAVSKAGNEMLQLGVKVGPLTFKTWVVFTSKNSDNVARFGRAIGKNVVEGKTLVIETEDCIGRTAKVELAPGDRINDKTGKPYLEIKRWLPLGAGNDDLMPDEIPF